MHGTRSERPATLSRQVVTALLRQELGIDGVVFTDSLAMGAVASSGSLGKLLPSVVGGGL